MSTIAIRSRLGSKVNYDITQDGALRYRIECANSLGHKFSLQDVTCGSACVLAAQQGAMSSKAQISNGAGQPVTTVDTGVCSSNLVFPYGGRSYRWKQKTASMSWTFRLLDETSGKEIAILKARLGMRGHSVIHLHEGHWDPAWLQLVVLTAVLAIKTGQLMWWSMYGI